MDLRQSLFELIARHQLDRAQARQLQQLSGLLDEPPGLARGLPRGVAVLAAALGGLGVVMWIAANWETLGRTGRFGLLQALVLATALGAARRPSARAPLGLLSLMGIGALFAYFGQTYQTGADAWQLFALWAVLALPLCLGARSDVLWAPWALVAMTALSLWTHTHIGRQWQVRPEDLDVHMLAWAMVVLLVAALSPTLSRYTGAGPWAMRTALVLAVLSFTLIALGGLFHKTVAGQYPLGLLMLAVSAGALGTRRWFDVFGLSAVALGLNALLVAGLGRWLFDGFGGGDEIGKLLLLGLGAAGLLAGTVSVILRLTRRASATGATA